MASEGAWRFLLPVAGTIILSAARSRAAEFEPRNFSGVGNNVEFLAWGSVGTTQIRAVAGADYADEAFTPPGDDRPTARRVNYPPVTTDIFLTSSAAISTKSALFVAWGQLLTYDLSLTIDNSTEPFDVPCNDVVDVWCPLGVSSDEISFDRSDSGVAGSVRSPINYATAYIDLDFVYGRSEEEAEALRTLEGGTMNITASGVPFQNEDGTWLIADQRTAKFPVTFALHIMLLLDHNRCCVEVAPGLGYEGDEDIYQACRGRTIATFQHVTENDFIIRLLGSSAQSIGISPDTSSYSSSADDAPTAFRARRGLSQRLRAHRAYLGGEMGFSLSPEDRRGADGSGAATLESQSRGNLKVSLSGASRGMASPLEEDRRRLYSVDDYDGTMNTAADVFTLTAGGAVLESAIPATVRIVSEGYVSTDDDSIELTVASGDMASLFERNKVGDIIRGAVLAPALAVDTYYAAAVSNLSPLFKLPVDAVQRGRDHGLPTYNAAREAYNLTLATDFSDVTLDAEVATLLSAAYGGDIDSLDAVTGALAEGDSASTVGGIFGELLQAAWSEQLYRTIAGDRLYHIHARPIESVEGTILSEIIERTLNVTDLPFSVFQVPGVSVCSSDSVCFSEADITLSDNFGLSWEEKDDDTMFITLRAKDIGETGMLGIGWGGLTMFTAQDYVICEVFSADEAECIDRSYVTTRTVPPPDVVDPDLDVTSVAIEGEWTAVTFLRPKYPLDDQDYDLNQDISDSVDTEVIYSFREGPGVGQHPNANRGAATVNFATANVESVCDDNDFVSLHGALMLIAWLLIAPIGIYFIRYRKGDNIGWAGREWFEMHEEIMIVASEAVLPLGITAVFASGGNHRSSHAHWGYYMIAAVAAQIFTGWMRCKGLEAKHSNFSSFHRCNKYFHIWAGRFAYLAGVVQCYRGLELVSDRDNLVFSAGDGLDLNLGTFGKVQQYFFPSWFAFIALSFAFLESRKQYRRYFKKGAAKGCGCIELVNEDYVSEADRKALARLMPRTEDLPIYTVTEFNDKVVLNGQTWVLVDGAILDVSNFSHRHPGGARLILNAVGTDITNELLGEELSVGHAMSFTPHRHPESAWVIARSLVVGYIEEDDEYDGQGELEKEAHEKAEGDRGRPAVDSNRTVRSAVGSVMLLPTSRLDKNVAKKADRLNSLAVMPAPPTEGRHPALSRQSKPLGNTEQRGVTDVDMPGLGAHGNSGSSKRLLERFHVCPLLLREKIGGSTSSTPNSRPVYRYIFQCPGQAKALVEAITGVCYFNMRAQVEGKGVIQRAYNAFAIRVHGVAPPTPGGGVKPLRGKGVEAVTVVPARDSTEGMLCIEMWIRLYADGAMSKLLDKLADDPDNPAVQLQGPFIIHKLVPPPSHRNVIMIAAGTGVNPMLQLIGDYLSFASRDPARPSRSRLVLVWQSSSVADLYGADEITAMQARSNGLLDVMVLIGGDRRKRNVPGAAFRMTKDTFRAARHMISPLYSSPSSSSAVSQSGAFENGKKNEVILTTVFSSLERFWYVRRGRSIQLRSNILMLPDVTYRLNVQTRHRCQQQLSDIGEALTRGKVSQETLEKMFGKPLLAIVKNYSEGRESSSNASRMIAGDNASGKRVDGEEANDGGVLEALCGSDTAPGKLQVVISGPSGFVFHVENILSSMGVPEQAIVALD
ncbi:unnamed protein product [Ascophyllum nodosum]